MTGSEPWWESGRAAGGPAVGGTASGHGERTPETSGRRRTPLGAVLLPLVGAVAGWVLATWVGPTPHPLIALCVVVVVVAAIAWLTVAVSGVDRAEAHVPPQPMPRPAADDLAASSSRRRPPTPGATPAPTPLPAAPPTAPAARWSPATADRAGPLGPPPAAGGDSGHTTVSPRATPSYSVDPGHYARTRWEREPQCPTCGHYGRLVSSTGPLHHFCCPNECDNWWWRVGEPWPDVVIVADLRRRQLASPRRTTDGRPTT